MTYALFTLGAEAKRVLEVDEVQPISLERRIPVQLSHLLGVNDIRLAAETAPSLSWFFAYWELAAINWKHKIIPDALAAFGNHVVAIEFDRGVEGLQFFNRTKMAVYSRGLAGFAFAGVVVVADREARTRALARSIGSRFGRVWFGTLDEIRTRGMEAPVFREGDREDYVSILPNSLLEVSCRAESNGTTTSSEINELADPRASLLRKEEA
jgi:hypothetical protein